MNTIRQLHSLGQSLWYDNIQRRLLDNGELAMLIQQGEIRGITSNPSIFQQAIARSTDYDPALVSMAWAGWDAEMIFWHLAIEDITRACDLFLPLFESSRAADGFVSLEVHPALAHDPAATLAQAKHLWETVDRPNLMIKIPATQASLPAVRSAIAAGINVNVTLIFSIKRYREVMEAFLAGLEDILASGQARPHFPASVASFFISRMDTRVDAHLPEDSPLRGRAAIANARLAYDVFRQTFSGPRWEELAAAGARLQRPLWASTSTKNPAYPDTLYVDSLVAPDTVNTVPPQTLAAYRDHGKAALAFSGDTNEARSTCMELELRGISFARLTEELEKEGLQAFAEAFSGMLEAIDTRRRAAFANLGTLADPVKERFARMEAEDVPARLWAGDPGLWTTDPAQQEEIRKRLGWLHLPETSRARLATLESLAAVIRSAGIRKFLLLGMGGSSLAPEVLSLVFAGSPAGRPQGVDFAILDSTDPDQVAQAARDFPPRESLYIVSSKSGGTAEVNAMLEYFWQLSGEDGSRFVAITDPGTSLDALANRRGFRATLLADPTVGGRFSVLADFGLFPMALMGLDLSRALSSAAAMLHACRPGESAVNNPGMALGVVLGEAALAGRDKLTLLADPPLSAFGSWLEQLIAESSGKQGTGIVVIDDEPLAPAEAYSPDRLFVYLRADGALAAHVTALRSTGQPVLEYTIPDVYTLVAEFYRWEIATATACHILGVNAFDQPNVQDNKNRTVEKMKVYLQSGRLDEPLPTWEGEGFRMFSNQPLPGNSLAEILSAFLAMAQTGDPQTAAGRSYIAINAYLPRNPKMHAALRGVRQQILLRSGCATTLGFGPRFLHSTGQLHKGGPTSGMFLQITADPIQDLDIPGQAATFGVLERAQALGDYEALAARGRLILRLHLSSPQEIGLLADALK